MRWLLVHHGVYFNEIFCFGIDESDIPVIIISIESRRKINIWNDIVIDNDLDHNVHGLTKGDEVFIIYIYFYFFVLLVDYLNVIGY